MISNPVSGASYFLQGLSLLNKSGVRRYVILPLLINILLFSLLLWLAADQFSVLMNWLMPSLTLPDWLSWLQWLVSVLSWLLWVLFAITAGLIMFFSFTIVANLVGAPFNTYLAAAVEKHLTGVSPESGKPLSMEIQDALLGELKKILYYLAWVIPLLLVSLIPALNIIAPVLWLVFSAWMMAIEYADYPLGNQGLTFSAIRRRLREKRILSLGFGAAVMLATMVPLLNFLVMPVAVAGATAMSCAQFRKELLDTSDE